MTTILEKKAPPSEFLLLEEGPMQTEYGQIVVSRALLKNAIHHHNKRGRKIGSDYEHRSNESRRNKSTKTEADFASPAFFNLALRKTRSGQHQLWAVDAEWTKTGADLVGSGAIRWFSPEFRENTDFKNVLDIKKIALTNDPATWNPNPMLTLSIGNDVHATAIPKLWSPMFKKKDDAQEEGEDKGTEDKGDPEQTPDDDAQDAPDDGPPPSAPKEPETSEPNEAAPDEPQDPADVEAQESDNLDSLMDVLIALGEAVAPDVAPGVPDSVRLLVRSANGIVADMALAQKKEETSFEQPQDPQDQPMPVDGIGQKQTEDPNPAAPPQKDSEDDMTEEDKKKLALLSQHFEGLDADSIASKLLMLSVSADAAKGATKALAATEETQKKNLLELSIRKGQISPHDKRTHERFLTLSIGAARSYCNEAPSIFDQVESGNADNLLLSIDEKAKQPNAKKRASLGNLDPITKNYK
jgi:hypothetical protein